MPHSAPSVQAWVGLWSLSLENYLMTGLDLQESRSLVANTHSGFWVAGLALPSDPSLPSILTRAPSDHKDNVTVILPKRPVFILWCLRDMGLCDFAPAGQ